jgi:hypothetical protein
MDRRERQGVKNKERNQPLICRVIGDRLIISIGIETLAWAAKDRNGGPVPNRTKVSNKAEWANDVSLAITHEDEIGNSMIHDMIDQAMQDAMDSGSIGLTFPEEKGKSNE